MNTAAWVGAIADIFSLYNILVLIGGVLLGIFIGAMPGMSSVMGLSIMLPFTFKLRGIASIIMLLGIFSGMVIRWL